MGLLVALGALVAAIAGALGLKAGLVTFGFAGAACLLAWLAREQWSTRKKLARAAAVGAAVVITGFISALAVAPARRSVFFIGSPKVEIRPEQWAFVPRGGETKVSVFVGGEEAGGEFRCEWIPPEYALRAAPACETAIRQPPDLLPPGEITSREFTVSVHVRKGNNEYPSASISLLATPAAEIHVEFEPRGALSRIYSGDDVEVRALLDGRDPPAGYTCSWEGEDELFSTDSCDGRFEADAIADGNETKTFTLSVEVLDERRRLVAPPATRDLLVYRTRSDYTVFVLEASRQVRAAWFEQAREDLKAQLQEIHDRTGEVGIVIFGAREPQDAPGCDNVHTLVNLAPLNLRQVKQSLESVVRGEAEAPLKRAITRAQESLAPFIGKPGMTSRVIEIVGGLNTCPPEGFDDFFADRERSITEAELQDSWVEFRFLPLTIFVDPSGVAFRQWRNSVSAQRLYRTKPFAVLFVRDLRILPGVVRAAATLAVDEPRERQAACNKLKDTFLGSQRDKAGANVIRRHCATVR